MPVASFAAGLVLALAAAPHPSSDVYFEQAVVAYVNGKATGPGVVSRVWHGGRRMRMEAGGVAGGPALVLRLDEGKAYRIDPASRTMTRIDGDALRAKAQMDAAMAGELMGTVEGARVKVAPLPRERVIAGHRCRGYRLEAGSTVMELWMTADIPLTSASFTEFLEWSGASQSLGPLLDEIRTLPGFPLQSRSQVSVMGETHETVATVTRVVVAPHAAALFDVPAGYRVVEETR